MTDPPRNDAISNLEMPPRTRKNPLSENALQDIQALLGKATTNGAAASKCDPMKGRRVMVPVTSKAFFEGVLDPPVKSYGRSGSDVCAFEEEIVSVHIGEGKYVDMTRSEAFEYFRKELSTPNNTQTGPTPSTKMISALKTTNKSNDTAKPHDHSKKPKNTMGEPTEPSLPLMEIREECDSSGNFLRSEVVNMSNEMKRLDETLKHASITDGEGDGEKFGKLLAQSLTAGEGSITRYDDLPVVHDKELGSEDEKIGNAESKSKQQPHADRDAEYLLLRKRLEELEKMEEEEENAKSENIKSSKRLQSSGWSKGFLNSRKKTIKKACSIAGHQRGNNKIETETVAERSIANNENLVSIQANPKVTFSATDDVKEIPRIGESKVPKKASPMVLDPSKIDDTDKIEAFPPVPSAPFEENIFRGVVKERNALTTCAGTEEASASNAGVPSGNNNVLGKKKLSRFAKQRLQKRG